LQFGLELHITPYKSSFDNADTQASITHMLDH